MIHLTSIPPDLSSLKFDCDWRGFTYHIGPTDRPTALWESLDGKTMCGTLALCAGAVLWCASRIESQVSVSKLRQMAEASFAYQKDWRYLNRDAIASDVEPDEPLGKSVSMGVQKLFRRSMNPDFYWKKYKNPVSEVFHIVHVTQYILPKPHKKAFQNWVEETNDRLNLLASRPDTKPYLKRDFASEEEYLNHAAAHRGEPIPPIVLDPNRKIEKDDIPELYDSFLSALDIEANPCLISPEKW